MSETTNVDQILSEVWGYDSFRPLQNESIQCVMRGQDSLTVLPTGGGKSLCFQVPAICNDGIAVVVSPLISLMKDQVDALTSCGVEAAFINSTQGAAEKRIVADQIRGGQLKLLYMAPERLLTERTLTFLQQQSVSFIAIDEAHCISNWGHDFRPEYRGLSVLKDRFPDASLHAYTATASEPVRRDIVGQLGLQDAEVLVGDFDRPNLTYRMLRSDNRKQQVVDVVHRHRGESGIIYCISRKEVDRTTAMLNQMGVPSLAYHAGMSDSDRKANQDAFIKETCDVIVATVAFGMGIDKSNVRYVIHAGMPKSIEHYQQESGRAGRDGLESECVLIYSGGDLVTWKKILSDQPDSFKAATTSLDAMYDLCAGANCRHSEIVQHFGQSYEHDSCNACDVCLDELPLVEDPTVLGQKILSCVVRLDQRFGAAHTTKVLTGSTDRRVTEFGHNRLSTYGLLTDEGQQAVRLWIDQLVGQRFLQRDGEYQTLSLTESGRRLISGNATPRLTIATQQKSSRRSPLSNTSWEGVDRGLFDRLRALRSELASAANVPAFVVFGDATLRELARVCPSNFERFAQINGVGAKKLSSFGDQFVAAITSYCADHGIDVDQSTKIATAPAPVVPRAANSNSFAAFDHFRRGESIEQVAEKLGRAVSTTGKYLDDYLRHEQIDDPTPWVDTATQARIHAAAHLADEGRLKPLFDHFDGQITYESLRIVLTCRQIAGQTTPAPENV